jgi:hypothetical protein
MIARLGLPLVIAGATARDYPGYCLGDDQNIVPATHRKGFFVAVLTGQHSPRLVSVPLLLCLFPRKRSFGKLSC